MGLLDFIDGGAAGEATGLSKQQLAAAQGIPLPVLKEYYPDLYKQVVQLNPELESAQTLGPSAMQGITTDPAARQAQLNALSKLQEIGNAGGNDAQSRADLSRIQGDVNSQEQGREGAIQQNLAARGLSGGLGELVQRNLSSQGAANTQAQQSLDAQAQAQSRALQALSQSGQLGGQLQAQDFGQQQAKAQAQDAISKFNTQNLQDVNNTNVGYKNNAQQQNAQAAQSTANSNTGLQNQAQQYNLGLAQQQYNNQLRKLGLMNDATQGAAGALDKQSAADKSLFGGLLSAGVGAAGSYAAGKK